MSNDSVRDGLLGDPLISLENTIRMCKASNAATEDDYHERNRSKEGLRDRGIHQKYPQKGNSPEKSAAATRVQRLCKNGSYHRMTSHKEVM